MAYGLTDLRTLARQFTRIGQDSSLYKDVHIDNALMLAAEDWVRTVKPTRTLSTLTLTAGTNNLGSMPVGWLPEYQLTGTLLYSGSLIDPHISFTDYAEVLYQAAIDAHNSTTGTAATGQPTLFGFKDAGTASAFSVCHPTPDKAYTLLLYWWNPAPTWTAGGTASGLSVISDEQWRIICSDGVAAFLQSKEPENRTLAAEARLRFERAKDDFKSRAAGGRGGQVWIKDDPDLTY